MIYNQKNIVFEKEDAINLENKFSFNVTIIFNLPNKILQVFNL